MGAPLQDLEVSRAFIFISTLGARSDLRPRDPEELMTPRPGPIP
jgi:hypothetical protein